MYYVKEFRALVGGGAGGAITPPTFLDVLNRLAILKINELTKYFVPHLIFED